MPEVSVINSDGRIKVIRVNLRVYTIEGFSGHSDRRQIIGYLRKVSPKLENVIVCHGERSKCVNFADFLRGRYKVNAKVPESLETIRLR